MKLWFMSVNRVSDTDFIRYGLHELASKGVEINVVDLSALMWGMHDYVPTNNISPEILFCSTFKEFITLVGSVDSNDIILCGGVLSAYLHLTLALKCRYIGVQTLGAIPHSTPINEKRFYSLIKKLKTDKLFRKLALKVFNILVFKCYPYYFVQRAGLDSSASYVGISHKTIILESQCYDIYQKLYRDKVDNQHSIINYKLKFGGNYFLWIDQAIPFHTDTLKCNGDISHLAENYFLKIQRFLKSIEITYGIKVIVALHPRIVIDQRYTEIWKNWVTENDNTLDLIEQADVCLTHNSTAIHTAVYYRKPLVVVKDKLLTDQGYDNGMTDSFYHELDCNLVESDSIEIPKLKFEINQDKYNNYIYKYVSNTSVQEPINANVLYDFIINISNKVYN